MLDDSKLDQIVQTINKSDINYTHFFNNLKESSWIRLLKERGFFKIPPKPIRSEGFVSYPFWPESRFLNRIVEKSPKEVLEIALELVETENVRVHEDFTDAACKMPPYLAGKWAKKEIEWVQKQDQIHFNLPLSYGVLIEYLAKNDEIETALRFAEVLLRISKDTDYEEKIKERKEQFKDQAEYYFPYTPKPQIKFDKWIYGEILKENVLVLSTIAPKQIFQLLCDLLFKATKYSQKDNVEEETAYSRRRAIENHSQNMGMDFEDYLIDAVRDTATKIIEDQPINEKWIFPILFDQKKYPYKIFTRIALHLLRVVDKSPKKTIKACLENEKYFSDHSLYHEYWLLAKDKLNVLSKVGRKMIIDWTLDRIGESESNFIKREKLKHDLDEQRIEKFGYARLRTEFSLIKKYLPLKLKMKYDKAVAEVGEAEHPDFLVFFSSGLVERGWKEPKENLEKMPVIEVVNYLKTWKLGDGRLSDSRDGMSIIIAEIVGKNPRKFSSEIHQFMNAGLHPIYIRGLVSGFRIAVNDKNRFDWKSVLLLCNWIVAQKREFPKELLEQAIPMDREEKNWGWTRSRIIDLIESGIKSDSRFEIPFNFKDDVWNILKTLTDDKQPNKNLEVESGYEDQDSYTLSINTVRGQAMNAMMSYGIWIINNLDKKLDSGNLSLSFDLMPEVRKVLEDRLDRRREKSLAIRSVYGRWFPYFVSWDKDWAIKFKKKIFQLDKNAQKYGSVAWGTYVAFNKPNDNVFKILKSEYSKAINLSGHFKIAMFSQVSPDERMAEHLMAFYWRGLTKPYKTGLVNKFFNVMNIDVRTYALKFVGRSLIGTDKHIQDDVLKRLRDLWLWRFNVISKRTTTDDERKELEAFGIWFESGKFDKKWALKQLISVLKFTGKIEASEGMVDQLANYAKDYPLEALNCFTLMVEDNPDGYQMYLWKDPSIRLLRFIINGTDENARNRAIDLVNKLGSMGHLEYGVLLQDI